MTPANILTPEQQEILKQAMRANNRLERIWSLYATSVAHDSSQMGLGDLLARAEAAVDVWMEFDDANRIDTTRIATETTEFLGKFARVADTLNKKAAKLGARGRRRLRHGAES